MAEWKETRVGSIPADWDCLQFERIILPDGLSYGIVQPGFHKDQNSVPVLRVNNIKDGRIYSDDVIRVDKDIEAKYSRSRLKGGELLLTVVGSVGECTLVPKEYQGWNVARAVSVSRIADGFDKSFVKYCFSFEQVKYQMYSHTNDTVQPTLNLSALKQIYLPIPPIGEQRAIASVLSSLDDKIDLLHRQNKTLEALAETLFRQWFVEEAEESWEPSSLYDAIEIIGGGTPKTEVAEYWDGDIKWISGKDITPNHKQFITHTDKTITDLGLEQSATKILPKYSTVISARGTVGTYCILAEPMAFSQTSYGIKPKFKDCHFFTYLLIAHSVEELKMASYGSIFDTITTNTFREQSIQIPCKQEIQSFEKKVEPYFSKMLLNQNQIRTLTQLRDTLLPKLMSGEVRVKTN